MNKKLITKLIATMLTITLTFANVLLLGSYVAKAYATDNNLENQGVATNDSNVEFDAYYIDASEKTAHSAVANINAKELKIGLYARVKKGYLKDIQVSMKNEEQGGTNFYLASQNEDMSLIESIDSEANVVKLKQINQDSQVIVQIPITANQEDNFNLANFNKQNQITIQATYVNKEGKEIAIQKTVKTNLEWIAEPKASLEQEMLKNKIYTINKERKLLLQTVVKTGLEHNILPIEKTQIQIQVPTIAGIKPETVKVIATQTMATNGKTGVDFKEENWKYNEETGTVGIITKNENQENQISWNKKQKDQYIITYIFSEEAIQKIEEQEAQEVKANQDVTLNVLAYGSSVKEVTQTANLEMNVKEEKGEIASSAIKGSMPKFSKGYLYSKIDQETSYMIENDVQIDLKEITDQVIVHNKEDKFVVAQEEKATTNHTYFKTTKISKEIFDKILGEEGFIKLLDKDRKVITTINKETAVNEENDYIYTYEGRYAEILLETSKPLVEGELKIQHEKALKTNINYVNEEIAQLEKFKMSASTQLKNAGQDIAYLENAIYAELIEPETKIEAEISNVSLSTVVKNENIQIKAILLTNDDSCMLYKNPVIEMEFPNFVEDINLKEAPQIMYDDALKVKEHGVYTNHAGNKVLRIVIQGEDTTYNFDTISKGANVVINADITLKRLTPTTDADINITVVNENGQTRTKSTSTVSSTKLGIRATAPVAMVTTTKVSGFNEKNETIYSTNAQEQTAKLNAKAQARTAKVEMEMINNYNNVVKNINILGRVPNGDSASLKTVINQKGVDASKVTVYYSNNAQATKDLTNKANGWTTTLTDLTQVKSYLVVIADYEMATGSAIQLSYEVNIAENLGYNQSTQASYTIYFDNVKEEQTIQDSQTAANIIFTTGEGPDLTTQIVASVANGTEVEEGSTIRYVAAVKNNGKSAVENVKLSVNIPEKALYFTYEGEEGTQEGITKVYNNGVALGENDEGKMTEYSQTFDKIEAGETKIIEFNVEVRELKRSLELEGDHSDNNYVEVIEQASLEVIAKATVKGYESSFESLKLTNKVVPGYINVSLRTEPVPVDIPRAEGETVEHVAEILNKNSEEKQNVEARVVLPQGVIFLNANGNGKYDATTRTIVWNIGTLKANASVLLTYKYVIDDLKVGEYEGSITTKVELKTALKDVTSNEVTIQVLKPGLRIKQTTTTPERVAVGSTIEYNAVIENFGLGDALEVKIVDNISSRVQFEKAQYTYLGKTYECAIGNSRPTISLSNLPAGEKVEVSIQATVLDLRKNEQEKEITNVIKVSAKNIKEIESNQIKHIIVKNTSSDDPSTGGDVIEGTHTISGRAWLDENKNGKRDESEKLLDNIQVLLINAGNGQIVKDSKTNQPKMQYTNAEGRYTFANIKSGKYIVVYFYDTNNYGLTTYQKDGVMDHSNSDAISMKVRFEGQDRQAAATNTLELTNSNLSNIDIGLINLEKFNLSLDKTITKITVNDAKGTKTYDYNNTKLAKLDLNSKYMNSANIIIEYKIAVTNIGAIPGYVKKIVDYLPKDMKFNAEMNTDWYVSDNGDAYNASLANTIINPGETKEVKLVLTKKMTENNTGTINNRAEIYEAYNDFAIADEDSTPGNKVSKENDMSSADAVIGVNTGETMIYITITLISIGILAVGIYFINKKVLRKI